MHARCVHGREITSAAFHNLASEVISMIICKVITGVLSAINLDDFGFIQI